jgi:hypothetical protein
MAKNVIFTKHFIEKSILKGVFDACGFENGKKVAEIALRGLGVIVPDKCGYKCIFEILPGRIVTIPFVYDNDDIIAKTVYPSQKPDKDEYYKKFKSVETTIK